MTTFWIQEENGTPKRELNERQVRNGAAKRNISLPQNIDGADLSQFDTFQLFIGPPPVYDGDISDLSYTDTKDTATTPAIYNRVYTVTDKPDAEQRANRNREFARLIYQRLDDFATSNPNYPFRDATECVSYTHSTTPLYKTAADYFITWRDDTWATARGIIRDIQQGNRPVVPVADLLAELPEGVWP